ncbi:hypothetical protein NRY95_03190 [Xanthomonas campestris pv. phormiicola]|nr:hypothetical protein [Xanthomonas campestris pv. phormiicola]UYC16990.1 hypothetical protein NRY95_03190 [Xanthomonas campestris pv. phormiicola]
MVVYSMETCTVFRANISASFRFAFRGSYVYSRRQVIDWWCRQLGCLLTPGLGLDHYRSRSIAKYYLMGLSGSLAVNCWILAIKISIIAGNSGAAGQYSVAAHCCVSAESIGLNSAISLGSSSPREPRHAGWISFAVASAHQWHDCRWSAAG